jgi:8-oxo-dGTP pyrophosphatase MutT (NUDIX family)
MIIGGKDAIQDWHERIAAVGARVARPFRKLGGFMELFRVHLPARVLGTAATRIGLLRQNSAFIIPVIEEPGGEVWTIIGEEFRAGAGMRLTGFAAGSNDQAEDLRALAIRELHEELGIDPAWLVEVRLIPAFAGANFVSPGATNEQIALYEANVRLPENLSIHRLRSRVRGAAGEAEAVTSQIRELNADLFQNLHNMGEKLGLLLLLLDRARRADKRGCAQTARVVDSILTAAAEGERAI